MKSTDISTLLTDNEKVLLQDLVNETISLSKALEFYTSVAQRSIDFPLEWEEKILRLALEATPERMDLLSRYRTVASELGKDIPTEIESNFSKIALIEEYSVDHQAAAQSYQHKTGFDDVEPEFRVIAERVRPYTMTSYERMYALYKSVEFIVNSSISGAFVECGVWRGGSMMLVAHALLKRGCLDRDIYLFDTYEGLPRPDADVDVDIWGNRAIDGWLPRQTGNFSSHWAEASIDDVRNNMLSTGYPENKIHFIKGMVQDTIPSLSPSNIALLRLDTDWYASTHHELNHLFPRLAHNGVLIIDDYGHFKGARKAVDNYLTENNLNLLMHRIDYTGRMMIKTN